MQRRGQHRLQGLRRTSEERLDSETPQERTERLAVVRQNIAARIESETPEERVKD